MLALILSIGIPLVYLIAGMFVSRNYWFNNRDLPEFKYFRSCPYCNDGPEHFFACPWKTKRMLPLKTIFVLVMWPLVFVSIMVGKFYSVPFKKLENKRGLLQAEIETLTSIRDVLDSGTPERIAIADQIFNKTKELEAMR